MANAFPDGELADAAEMGAVDSRSVRVWVRCPGVAEVEARLEVDGYPPVIASAALSAATDWTGVLVPALSQPAPDRAFVCTVGGRRLTGWLAPDPATHAGVTFGFGSCHRPYELDQQQRIRTSAAAGIYPAMLDVLRRRVARFLLLCGDQVYSDELAPISVRDNLPGDEQHPPPLDVAVAAYRRVSRGFLGQSGFRALREAFPTYCMWDDHDIFNNWGSHLEKTPLDRRLFEAAGRVYCEYQHQRNPGGGIGPPPYQYTFRHGDIGFLALDVRGARDYDHGQLLGSHQWAAIQEYLRGPDAATVQTLFVVTSIPVAHVSRWMAEVFEFVPGKSGDQVRDRWCSSAFITSRDAVLRALFRWQTGAAHRQVILLSGDVHAASGFTIRRRRGPGVIHQFTSSALSTPHTGTQRLLNAIAVRLPNLFEPHLRFQHHFLAFANNFGLAQVEPRREGGHRVALSIHAWDPSRRRLTQAARMVCTPGE